MRWLLFVLSLRRSKIINKDSRWPSTTNPSPNNPGGKRHKIQGSCGRDRTTSGARGASLSLSPSAPCLLLVSIRAEKQAFPPFYSTGSEELAETDTSSCADAAALPGNKCRNVLRKLYVTIRNLRSAADNQESVKTLCSLNTSVLV